MKGVNKAVFYILLKSKSTVINMAGMAALGSFMMFLFFSEGVRARGSEYLLLFLEVVILGTMLFQANSMILDVTVKDRMCRRGEFLLASGIDFMSMIKGYTLQMFRVAMAVPFVLFAVGYYWGDLEISFGRMIVLFVSAAFLCYSEILFLNVISFSVVSSKYFKNTMVMGTFLLVYMSGMWAKEIAAGIAVLGIKMDIFLIIFNAVAGMGLFLGANRKMSLTTNEMIVRSARQWI